MTCPTCGWPSTKGCEPVTRRGVEYCSLDCALDVDDRRAAALDIADPVDPDAPLSLYAIASIEQAKRHRARAYVNEPDLTEDL